MVRKAVAPETQNEVLAACRRRCAICFGLSRDVGIKPGQIAHLDRNAANPSFDNLAFLCLEHHDQFDSRSSQSKGLTPDEVRQYRQELVAAIEQAWQHPPTFGSVEVSPPDGVSGRWVRGDNLDSAEIEVSRMMNSRVRVRAFALHGKTRHLGPSVGELDFESELIDDTVMFVDKRRPGETYTLRLRSLGDRVVADEQGAFGHFGTGAHLGGDYHLPTADRTARGAAPALAPQRLTIREKSAAEILRNLKGIELSYRFHEKVEELYVDRWTREPGWRASMYDLPSKLSGVRWHCCLKEVDSGTLLFASTTQDVSMLRIGDLVTVSGRISGISQLEYVSLEDAVVRADSVSSP